MIKVIGVRFRTAGKVYYFDPVKFEVKKGDHVIVETARGIEFGTVVSAPKEVEDEKVIQPLKAVLRLATAKDIEQETSNKVKEREAYRVCLEKIKKHELDMKLIDAEYTFDNNKVLFYFTADGRIDFRELVKDLASVFKTRIELRQIGVRDETKIVGGMGICGRPLCCHTHLTDFAPVSIKMAKEQNLSLNPTKISGVCGRLMCCLSHEEETYEELNSRLPNIGEPVTTEDGMRGEVQSVSVLRQQVKVLVEVNDEKELREYKVEQLQFRKRHGKNSKAADMDDAALKELEKLEKIEKTDKQKTEQNDKPGQGAKAERTDRFDKGERAEKAEAAEGSDRNRRNDRRSDRGNKPDGNFRNNQHRNRPRNGERPDNADRPRNGERSDNVDRPRNGERSVNGDKPRSGERAANADRSRNGERAASTDRSNRGEQRDRQNRNGHNRSGRSDRRNDRRNTPKEQ